MIVTYEDQKDSDVDAVYTRQSCNHGFGQTQL